MKTLASLLALFAVCALAQVFTFTNTSPVKSVGVRTAATATPGEFVSVTKYGDTGDDFGQAVAVDTGGNLIIGGSAGAANGGSRPFVGKQSPSGTLVWSNFFDGNGIGSIQAVAADSAGDVLVTGYFMGTLSPGGGASLTSTLGSYNIFVAKFSRAGLHLWSKRFGTLTVINPGMESGNGIATDPADNSVVVTGYFSTDVDFGNGPIPPGSGQNLFLVKLSPNDGGFRWARSLHSGANTVGNAVAVDAGGNVFVAGGMVTYSGLNPTADFGAGPTPVTNSVMFVAKYTGSGGYAWAKQYGASAEARAVTIAGNNVAVVGRYQMSINFGGQTFTNPPSSNPLSILPNSIFAAGFSAANGAHAWSRSFGVGLGTGAAAADGGVTMTAGQGFIASLAVDGTTRWSKTLFGPAQCSGVAADAQGNSYVVGNLRTTVDFGGGPVTSAGRADIFVLKLGSSNAAPVSSASFPITLTGPFDDPDGDTNVVYFVARTTQFSNNVTRIEASDFPLFPPSGTAFAEWGCYPIEQQVAAFIFTTRGAGNKFYRASNTPCAEGTGAGSIMPASMARATLGIASKSKPVPKFIQNYRTKDGLKVGTETPSTNPKARLFTLVKPAPRIAPPPPMPAPR